MIEPRLTAHRPMTPTDATDALVEWLRDLEQEALARIELLSDEESVWRPHPDANDAQVTLWHVARWLDVLAASRIVTAPSMDVQVWETDGFLDETGYDPSGIGYLGLGTLTGYTPDEMRAVPRIGLGGLSRYLRGTVERLVPVARALGEEAVNQDSGFGSPFQLLGSTIQGSFGHLGEIDCLVSLRAKSLA